ncbi:L domain-like protein [Rhizoclosmatium globosum]|uniref:L domain-like protein n=1 Tax=Rhizoclosmatium globosum TaxID=329046 RepID=A0A1Y2CEJ9_9FUNG|nr:L domain-like protein [Rhizoclosmatium globosum]|eukprot:ORY45317.1 L domain-like protein [Rhizoclosmatium globosum]
MYLLTKQFSVLVAPRYLFNNEALESIRASHAHRFVYEGWFEQPISKLFKFPRYFQEVVVDDVFRGLEYLEINNVPNEIQSWRKDDQLIPAAFGRFSKLYHLSITSSEFKGPVPMEIWNMPNLKVLFFGMFPLNQPLPAEISGLKSLIALTMTDCLLYGSIPPEIGLLTSLRRLSLTDNKLTGNIPSELGNLSNLLELELCFNKLSGTIPIALGNLNKLQVLDLQENMLTGVIPSDFGNLKALRRLSLKSNGLFGLVPIELASFSLLQTCDLRQNHGLECNIKFLALRI